ncbi:hypothetical protein LTR99_000896 [Exophiala xenobiotica]|uniref:Major facilitator superfamily (MFS) profile domain-containing protein n=1 Tax=Vermiconidia calcicola TaxID=1690605 RepID=A0AAV9QN73_9PEZI|nr:hypothetical protein LTR96_003773 [Exophiala xenobiotica]KAK5540760.1 hypothetical protein LTR23_005991 [Chaetothyriales sp. CCFEE 6169]KAK5545459.1 hypothetical protein LTR25_000466 [Vermiconidia calcicola]KAK5307924.1 hypothetical protein LTR99_000896 [Exophiala xenobiotica]KAK5343179.1 hypothetical protein LTR98_000808 [Exophiala xenobiotica]
MAFAPWRALPGRVLLAALNLFSAVALIFEGYNQGVMGSVNGSAGYIDLVGIGADGVVTNTTKQGGIVAVYYFGAMFGCFIGGKIGDRFGRKKAVVFGSILALIGGALQAGSQNASMTICARTICGLGIGTINSIIPAWVSELAQAHNRGSSFALVFVANYVGIVIAYWIGYGLRNHVGDFKWRFPLAFQIVPLLLLLLTVGFLPESPRYLLTQGRRDEAVEILAKIRGDVAHDDPSLAAELAQLDAIISSGQHKRYRWHNLITGRHSGPLHLGRRVALAVGIMMMMEWTGILAITVYANTLFQQAGFSVEKSAWLSGLCNSIGILGTMASVLTVDRFGRRRSLYFGFFIQGAVLLLSGGLSRLGELHPENTAYGAASGAMVFIFTFFFAQTVLMIAFIYPTEIWPQEIRALGNSFGVFGWAVGCGSTTLAIPSMFAVLGYKALIVFGAFNFASLPLVYLFFPETKGRSLEEINLLFASASPLASANEAEYTRLLTEAGGDVAQAEHKLLRQLEGPGAGESPESKLEQGREEEAL